MRPFGLPTWIALLGFSGLLPSIALLILSQLDNPATHGISFWGVIYGALVLNFIGGSWWALGGRYPPRRQPAGILILSILPTAISLPAFVMMFSFANLSPFKAGLLFGGLLIVSPLVDRWLSVRRMTPRWWMTLRVPLSLLLGVMTIACGWLAS